MDNQTLAAISEDLFKLTVIFHKKITNPDDFIKRLPMPQSQFKVIFYLSHRGPSSVSQIGSNLCISKPNMTPIIDKLIADGYVCRNNDPKDRRIIKVELTEKAHEFFRNQKQILKDRSTERLKSLEEEDLLKLQDSLKTILSLVDKI